MSAAETAIDNMAKGQALPRNAPTGTELSLCLGGDDVSIEWFGRAKWAQCVG